MRHEAERSAVLAGHLVEVPAHRFALLRDAHHIGSRVLHTGDVLAFEEPLYRVDRHVDDRARRDVVDDDWNTDRVVDRLEVLVQALLRGLVVVGRDDQDGIRTRIFRVLGEVDGLAGRVGARPPDHGDALLGLVDAPFDHALVLVMAQGWAFARGPHWHEPVRAFGDLPVDQGTERRLVHAAVLERRHAGSERTSKARL